MPISEHLHISTFLRICHPPTRFSLEHVHAHAEALCETTRRALYATRDPVRKVKCLNLLTRLQHINAFFERYVHALSVKKRIVHKYDDWYTVVTPLHGSGDDTDDAVSDADDDISDDVVADGLADLSLSDDDEDCDFFIYDDDEMDEFERTRPPPLVILDDTEPLAVGKSTTQDCPRALLVDA